MKVHNAGCVARHMGPWLAEPGWLAGMVSAWNQGRLVATRQIETRDRVGGAYDAAGVEVRDGIAVVPIIGAMMKGSSKFEANADTVGIRRALATARRDPDVTGVLLHIDSPGGTYAGTGDLADDVAVLNREKPVHAYIQDLGASAAYWVASQARRITINRTGEVGSIGTVAVVEDLSGMAEQMGVVVHVISTGDYKGAFAPGAPVTEEHLAYLQERVEQLNTHFLAAVGVGRRAAMTAGQVRAAADGRTWLAGEALKMGLVDGLETLDAALGAVVTAAKAKTARARVQAAKLKSL